MNNYRIFIRSEKHPRTVNSFRNSRCYFDIIEVSGNRDDLKKKVRELLDAGEHISDIYFGISKKIYLFELV